MQAHSGVLRGLAGVGLTARQGLRVAGSLGLGLGMIWLLAHRLSAIEPAEVAAAFAGLPPQAWALALGATAASFWAVGRYDAVIHRHFATGQSEARTRLAGICAIAVSQMIGLGVVTGSILRWRMLPETTLLQAARLTAAVALSFLAAWAMVTSLVLVALPGAPFKGWAAVMLGVGCGLALVSIAAPRLAPRLGSRLGPWRFRWPNGFTLSRLFGLCVVDTLAAALAFHALCPPETALPFATLLPAFLLALGAGLISGAPGGIGAFEMTLLALLPGPPEPDLIAAVIAWRLVYFVLPAVLGAGLALRGPGRPPPVAPRGEPTLATPATCAELQLARQGAHEVTGSPAQGLWLTGRTSHCLVALFAPLAEPQGPTKALQALSRAAASQGRLPVLYKAQPRLAATARAMGAMVLPLAREAVLHLGLYDLGKPARAGLRRKLRRAEAAGICILSPGAAPDWPALDRIAAAWATHHGAERGFSMGRYDRRYVQGQRLYVAVLNDQPVAFVTFHEGREEWVLDLMRHVPDLPDGTMHLLVQTAISDAARAGLTRLSLAAAPEGAFADAPGWLRRMVNGLGVDAGAGLARFKSAFAPDWERRYLCLPNRLALPLVLAELTRAIHRPGPLPIASTSVADLCPIENDHEEYAFASVSRACQDNGK